MANDLYDVLGVSKNADASDIKKAYRKLARQYHPDRNPDDTQAEARFKEISAAFEILGDEDKRKLYDEFGLEGLRAGFDPNAARAYHNFRAGGGTRGFTGNFGAGGAGFEDLFSSIFGQGFGQSGAQNFNFRTSSNFGDDPFASVYNTRQRRSGEDINVSMTLDFDFAIKGGEKNIQVGSKEHRIKIPSGARDGDILRLKGKGEPPPQHLPGATPGDLRIKLSVSPHPDPNIQRDGLDLIENVYITMPEAILGTEVRIETPQGAVNVTIKPLTPSGTTLRLTNRGIKRGKATGNYMIKIDIKAPVELSDDVKKAAELLRSAYPSKNNTSDSSS